MNERTRRGSPNLGEKFINLGRREHSNWKNWKNHFWPRNLVSIETLDWREMKKMLATCFSLCILKYWLDGTTATSTTYPSSLRRRKEESVHGEKTLPLRHFAVLSLAPPPRNSLWKKSHWKKFVVVYHFSLVS